ncbi:sugar phosphate isomerase/epimerase family protein [Fodinicola acaciae]|uniref:sugar phosphate isomerase/epimerase family protein n=1 Tax=Fodinicola acaciae TaxID=2681555 RepID=UPI0013D59561|nr:TIM barrel protein [Fodinicola acaciae]
MSVRAGLVSVTFRQLSVPEVVDVAAKAGLAAVEWGGDVHVPDVGAAVRTRDLAADAGLAVAAYGSYYRAGVSDPADFAAAARVAVALGAPYVRVWAGRLGSAEATDDYRAAVVRALKAATGHGVTVAVEYHPNTLTDTLESALRLFDEVGPGVVPYWQPWDCHAVDAARAQVRALLPYGLPTVHVFSWDTDGSRLPLSAGERLWRTVLDELSAAPGSYNALLEFVVDNDPALLAPEAETLLSWLNSR